RFAIRKGNRVRREQSLGSLDSFVGRKKLRLVHWLLEQFAVPKAARFDIEDRPALTAKPLARSPGRIRILVEGACEVVRRSVETAGKLLMHLGDRLRAD